jgi:hypothetical protein
LRRPRLYQSCSAIKEEERSNFMGHTKKKEEVCCKIENVTSSKNGK